MVLLRPRLNDCYDIPITQEEVDFAIPFLDEDIPLYLDPFLLWKSPSQQENSLHLTLTNCFNHLGYLLTKGQEEKARDILIKTSECHEVGLGNSKTRIGKPIGVHTANEILRIYKSIPQIRKSGFIHFEEIQLYVKGISKDRVSDFACSFLKSFLIDYTIGQCNEYNIPIEKTIIELYNSKTNAFVKETTHLPQNPETKKPIILVPKRWLRLVPWINYEDYSVNFYAKKILKKKGVKPEYNSVLNFNRQNFDVVQTYLKIKELRIKDCKNDPLFTPIPVLSTKRKIEFILKLPSGKTGNADKKYEDFVCQLMASLVYPQLDFAQEQSRTDSNVLIRDLIFYNNRSYDFLEEIYDKYDCHQIVFELKNVKELERDHINQLNRYVNAQFGRLGIIITRNPPPKNISANIIDLWSGQRRCILVLTDTDLKLMCEIYEGKQRKPIDVIKKKYIEFIRNCPS
jgi:hypothetical protein